MNQGPGGGSGLGAHDLRAARDGGRLEERGEGEIDAVAPADLVEEARDELGITAATRPRPIQAALASATSFTCGAILPIVAILLAPRDHVQAITIERFGAISGS